MTRLADFTETAKAGSPVDFHLAGKVPATTALRVLLNHADVCDPHSGAPFSEAMLFGIAGGIGIGVSSFFFGKDKFASFSLAGRHLWHDDLACINGALGAFGLESELRETSGPKTAARQLREAVAQHGPVIAWVDLASLPHRGMPEALRGRLSHVVTGYEVDEQKNTALIGDLSGDPIAISLTDLEAARGRIRKQRFRVLWIAPRETSPFDLRALIEGGLRRCRDGFRNPAVRGLKSEAQLEAIETWGERFTNSDAKQGWPQMFRPGATLWRALSSVHDCIENHGTGGGLCRPLFADFLQEASTAVRWPALQDLAAAYRELGRGWSELADRALPGSVPAFRRAKELRQRLAALREQASPGEEVSELWEKLSELERQAAADFPLSTESCSGLFAGLKARLRPLYAGETAALAKLEKVLQ